VEQGVRVPRFSRFGPAKFEYVSPFGSEAAEELAAQVERRRALEDKLRKVRENLNQVKRLSCKAVRICSSR
jgi:hypothetical protein